MQLNTTAAVTTALISAVIGFGLAFFIERKINRKSHTKAQKILVTFAMVSFGYGLTAFLNEIMGFPLQGLQIRYNKLIGYVVANIVLLPFLFLGVVKLIGIKNKEVTNDLNNQKNKIELNSFKYLFICVGIIAIGYFGYAAIQSGSYDATYDLYVKVDYKNCNSQYEEKPVISSKLMFKQETNEVFLTTEYEAEGTKKKHIQKLDHCSVLDAKNWTCGGEWTGSVKSSTYMFIDGEFVYEAAQYLNSPNCPVKIVKR